jgi:hypothetical protein
VVLASVTVASGKTSATFNVGTAAVLANTTATVTATYNGVSKSATLTVDAAALTGLSFNPPGVQGGKTSTLTVTLNGKAPTGGVLVVLSSNKPTDLVLPVNIKILAGATSGSATVSTISVKSNTIVAVTGTLNAIARSANLTLTP